MIQVSHLTKQYGPRTAIEDLNFNVTKGEIVGFLGPNGAGKTTTMKILTCFIPPTSGTAQVAGFDVFYQPHQVKKNIGYLPETPPVYLEMVVEDYITFAAKLHDVPANQLTRSVHQAIEKTGLGSVRNRLIGNLSKGYRQRVGLAQALVHNPPVLILDEPTVGLDPKQIIEIRELIKSLAGDHTVILSSHILPEITATCHRVIVINKGQIVAQDTIARLTAQNEFTLVVKNPHSHGIEAIRKVSGVQKVQLQNNEVLVEFNPQANQHRDQVVEVAVQNQMGVLEFSASKLSLEQVFLKLTTGEK